MSTLVRLLAFLKPSIKQILLSVLAGLATIAAGVGMLGTSAYLIASAALHPSIAELQVAIVGVRFFGISRGVFRYAERLVSHSVNLKVLSNIRVWFYQHLEPLAPAHLQDTRSGDLLQGAVGDIEILENFYVRFVMPVIVAVIASAAASLFIGTLFTPLGWLLAAGLVINGLFLPTLMLLSSKRNSRNLVRSQAAVSAGFVEFVQSLGDLQVFGADQEYIEQIQADADRHTRLVRRNAMQNSFFDGLALLVTHLTMISALWIMFPPVQRGELSGVLLSVAALLILSSFEATSPLPLAAQQLNASLEAAARIFDITVSKSSAAEKHDLRIPASSPSRISFEKVSFSYEQDPVLKDLDLVLERGRKVAVVGASGAGKSTLVNLLLRFWNPDAGAIRIDGQDIAGLDEEWLRRQLGVVNPGTAIFNLSLRENLLLAQQSASDGELMQVITAAELGGWFEQLPLGLDSYLGELGAALSAGERQRLSLARVMLQRTPFLLLDEPTSNLDHLTGARVLANLLEMNPRAGVMMITHDLLHLEAMDEILVMKDGMILERGGYSELIQEGGLFAAWVGIQRNSLDVD